MKRAHWFMAALVGTAAIAAPAALARVTPVEAEQLCRAAAAVQIEPSPTRIRVVDMRNTAEGLRMRLLFLEPNAPNRRAICLVARGTEEATVTLEE